MKRGAEEVEASAFKRQRLTERSDSPDQPSHRRTSANSLNVEDPDIVPFDKRLNTLSLDLVEGTENNDGAPSSQLRSSASDPQATPALSFGSSNTISGRNVTFTTATVNNYHGAPLVNSVIELQQRIATWLSPSPNYRAIQKETHDKAASGTGQWLLQKPIFKDWLLMESGTLWGTGIPGAGKTYLASIIIHHLTEQVIAKNRDTQTKPAAVVCVYCRYNDKLTTRQILASLLGQLVEDSEEAAAHIEARLYIPCEKARTIPTPTELLAQLRHVLSFFSRSFIVVDALDELSDDVCHELVQALASLNQHLLLTSRDIHLRNFPTPDFIIRAPCADLQIFIKRELGRFPRILSITEGKPELLQDIINQIERKADGMFLLAALQLQALKGITTVRSLRNAVAKLPSTLNDTYQATLYRINEQATEESSLALRAILWVTYAVRSLKLDELLVALSIEPEIDLNELDPEAIPNEGTLLAVCCGLVTIDKEDRTVRLVHFTARDFFVAHQTGIFPTPQAYLASACATYLLLADICIPPEHRYPYYQFQSFAKSCPLFEYASTNLGYHIQRLSPKHIGEIPLAVQRYLAKQPRLAMFTGRGWLVSVELGSVIHFGAFYDILPLVSSSTKGHLNSPQGETSSNDACAEGDGTVATHIPGHLGPEQCQLINQKSGASKMTPLHIASKLGRDPIVKILLDWPGIDINAVDTSRYTALHYASINGHTQVVQLLLGFPGVDVNAKTKWSGDSALHLACARGHTSVVLLLMNAPGININAQTKKFVPFTGNQQDLLYRITRRIPRTPLDRAIQEGHTDIVTLLMERGAKRAKLTSSRQRLRRLLLSGVPYVRSLFINKGDSGQIRRRPKFQSIVP